MEPGLYVTFFRTGEPRAAELPPVGPLEHLVLREGVLIATRKEVLQVDESIEANASRWIEAELELQRAMGNEPGGAVRPHLRIAARDGVYLRFASFGEFAEPNPAPELGPYAVVTVGSRGIEGDGDLLAVPTGSKRALWDLTSTAGKDLAGVVRPDIAFRSKGTDYHAGIRPVVVQPATKSAPAPVIRGSVVPPARTPLDRPPEPLTAPAQPRPALAGGPGATTPTRPREVGRAPARMTAVPAAALGPAGGSSLLTRVSTIPRRTRPIDFGPTQSEGSLEWAEALWRMRLVIMGVLVLLVAVTGLVGIKSIPSTPSVNIVPIGKTVVGARWDYTVGNVARGTSAGNATPRGVYLLVRIGLKNQASEGAILFPTAFGLVDGTGAEYPALSESDSAYRSAGNTTGQYVWPKTFPVGQTLVATVIFDIPPSVSGLQFVIHEVPQTRVRLE